MQNFPVTREWDEADWLDPLIYFLKKTLLNLLIILLCIWDTIKRLSFCMSADISIDTTNNFLSFRIQGGKNRLKGPPLTFPAVCAFPSLSLPLKRRHICSVTQSQGFSARGGDAYRCSVLGHSTLRHYLWSLLQHYISLCTDCFISCRGSAWLACHNNV